MTIHTLVYYSASLLPLAVACAAYGIFAMCIRARINTVGPMHTVRRQPYGKRTSLMR